jgi:hypothetical protein
LIRSNSDDKVILCGLRCSVQIIKNNFASILKRANLQLQDEEDSDENDLLSML